MASSVQLARPALTLHPLTLADTTLVPVQPQFLQMVSDHLGDHLTSVDGFDDLLNTPLSLIDADAASIDSLTHASASVADTAGAITAASLDPIGHDIATFQSNGDTILTSLGIDSAAPDAPAPAQPPAPGGSGGSGGGGGGNPGFNNQGGGGPDYCQTSFCYFSGRATD